MWCYVERRMILYVEGPSLFAAAAIGPQIFMTTREFTLFAFILLLTMKFSSSASLTVDRCFFQDNESTCDADLRSAASILQGLRASSAIVFYRDGVVDVPTPEMSFSAPAAFSYHQSSFVYGSYDESSVNLRRDFVKEPFTAAKGASEELPVPLSLPPVVFNRDVVADLLGSTAFVAPSYGLIESIDVNHSHFLNKTVSEFKTPKKSALKACSAAGKTSRNHRVRFDTADKLIVFIEIPSHDSLTSDEKLACYHSKAELREMACRNKKEVRFERKQLAGHIVEDHEFHIDWSGNKIHPAHLEVDWSLFTES